MHLPECQQIHLSLSAVERTWHIQDSQDQNLALALVSEISLERGTRGGVAVRSIAARVISRPGTLQGYLAHKKQPAPRTLH